jgi:hypothetical protein
VQTEAGQASAATQQSLERRIPALIGWLDLDLERWVTKLDGRRI